MTSLLTLRHSPPPALPYLADALPHVYSEAGKTQFKAIPGMRWIPDRKAPNGRGFWRGPREAVELVAEILSAAGVCKVTRPPWDLAIGCADLEPLADARLRGYQAEGAAWIQWQLARSHGALLADEMGLGKTPQAITAIEHIAGPRLVVCPAVVVPHWESEIARWSSVPLSEWGVTSWDGLVSVMGDSKPPKAKARAAELARLREIAHAAKVGVFDELHYAANPKAQRSTAAREWRKLHPDVPCAGLSGTPMTARPRDLHHPLDLLWPGRFGRWWDFTARYCDGHYEEITNDAGVPVVDSEGEPLHKVWVADGISNAGELRARLSHCMLRRTKAQVGAELPPRTRVIHEVTLPAASRKDHRHAIAASFDLGRGNLSAVGALLGNAEQFKLAAAEALARDVMASGSRPLLLTTRKDSVALLSAALECPGVTGEDAATERRGILAGAPCAVATMYSVETGINLTGFDVIIFVGLDWVPSKILQAESRIHRIGQDRPCTIYYLIARGTVDEVIRERVIERLEAFAAITGAKGDELGLAGDLAPESQEELIAAIVAAAKGKAA